MPLFTDADGVQWDIDEWPGNSYKAAVINRALRRGEFDVFRKRGAIVVMYTCELCGTPTTSAGVAGDHIIPQRAARSNAPEVKRLLPSDMDELFNLRLSCIECNSGTANQSGIKTRSTFTRQRMAQHPKEVEGNNTNLKRKREPDEDGDYPGIKRAKVNYADN